MISIPNATIIYRTQASNPLGEDPVTGEPIFEVSTTESSFRCSLEKDTTEAAIGEQPGKDRTEHFHSGKAELIPSQMPSWYKPGVPLKVKFDNDTREYDAYAYYVHPSRLGLDDFFGTSIEIVIIY